MSSTAGMGCSAGAQPGQPFMPLCFWACAAAQPSVNRSHLMTEGAVLAQGCWPERLLQDSTMTVGPVLSRWLALSACMTQLSTWLLQVDAGKAEGATTPRHVAEASAINIRAQPPPTPSTHPDDELSDLAITVSQSLLANHLATTTSGLDKSGTATKTGSNKVVALGHGKVRGLQWDAAMGAFLGNVRPVGLLCCFGNFQDHLASDCSRQLCWSDAEVDAKAGDAGLNHLRGSRHSRA